MKTKIFNIAKNILLNTFRDKGSLIWLIVMPIVWTTLIGSMSSPRSSPNLIPISIINYDKGAYSNKIEEFLLKENTVKIIKVEGEEDLTKKVIDTEISVGLIIPENFSENLISDKVSQISIVKSEKSSSYLIEELIKKTLKRISIDAQSANFAVKEMKKFILMPNDAQITYWERAFQFADSSFEPEPSISVNFEVLSVEKEAQSLVMGMNLSSPGFAVMFVMMGVFFAGAAMVHERHLGTLARLLTTPTSKLEVISGNMFGFFLLALIQFLILILFGQFILGVNWLTSPLGVLLIVVSFSLAVTGLGTLLAIFVKTSAQAGAFAVLISMVTSMIGGSWWPIEIAPKFMQSVARFTPQFWAVDGLTKLITRGFGILSILPNFSILMGIALFSLSFAVIFFKFSN